MFWSMLGGQRWVDERMREDLGRDENDDDDNSGDMPN